MERKAVLREVRKWIVENYGYSAINHGWAGQSEAFRNGMMNAIEHVLSDLDSPLAENLESESENGK